jgi:hypothetical protein
MLVLLATKSRLELTAGKWCLPIHAEEDVFLFLYTY